MHTYKTPLHTLHTFHTIHALRAYHTSLTKHIHTCLHPYRHTCIHACIHAYILIYMYTSIRTYINTYIHTYRHTYLHTYRQTSIHTLRSAMCPFSKIDTVCQRTRQRHLFNPMRTLSLQGDPPPILRIRFCPLLGGMRSFKPPAFPGVFASRLPTFNFIEQEVCRTRYM